MKPAPFDYVKPTSLDEACRLLAEAGGGATVIAGGQPLMPLLNLRMSQPFVVVHLAAIEELPAVRHADGITSIGAMLRQNVGLRDPIIAAHLPALAQALRHVGHHQSRNRGTIGGSIAFAEPAAECPAAAVALGAQMRLRSVRGERHVAVREFYLGPYMTAMGPDELLVAIEFPDWPEGHQPVFGEVARRPGDFALVGFVGALAVEDGNSPAPGWRGWAWARHRLPLPRWNGRWSGRMLMGLAWLRFAGRSGIGWQGRPASMLAASTASAERARRLSMGRRYAPA